MESLAHISEDGRRNHPLKDHLGDTAQIAGRFASVFHGQDWAISAAIWHALGKYKPAFQAKILKAYGVDVHLENVGNNSDHSTARGLMTARKLIIFKHDSVLGNASAQSLFDNVYIKRASDSLKPARDFSDYKISTLNEIKAAVPQGVEVIEML